MKINKNILIGVVAVGIIGGAIYYFRRKKSDDETTDEVLEKVDEQSSAKVNNSTESTSTGKKKLRANIRGLKNIKGVDSIREYVSNEPYTDNSKLVYLKDQYGMGYLSKRSGIAQVVTLTNRPIKGTIRKGQLATIKGTTFDGTYPITAVWIDGNDKVGAIYLPIGNRYTPTSNRDETFTGKGLIEIKTPKSLKRFGFSSVTGSNKFDVELLNDI